MMDANTEQVTTTTSEPVGFAGWFDHQVVPSTRRQLLGIDPSGDAAPTAPAGPVGSGEVADPLALLPGWDDDTLPGSAGPVEVLEAVEGMPPGPFLGILLGGIDPASLSGIDQIRLLQAHTRMVAHHQAMMFHTMATIYDTVRADLDGLMADPHAGEAAAAEIAVGLHLTRRAAERDLQMALALRRVPQVAAALTTGQVDRRRAGTILHETAHLPDIETRQVVDQLIDQAPFWTTGQLRARLQRLIMATNPDAAQARYQQAVDDRRVTLTPTEVGTARLVGADLPPDRAAQARDRIETLARHLHRNGETRSLDQLRADIYLDLLCGTLDVDPTRGRVHLSVDLHTLTGLVDTPGELDGYGPIVADLARQLALTNTNGQWTWTVTDPDTGAVLADGTTRRRPTTRQHRHLATRQPRCCFPGCRMPAIDCDLDHTVPWKHGGKTLTINLGPLCRHHHHLHDLGWTYTIDPDGRIHWTSPLGQTTIVHPDRQSRPPP